MEVAKTYQTQLPRIKNNVRSSYDYFKPNYDRYNEFTRFVFESTLREEEITLLMTLSQPQLEFNILEPYISRLVGEFAKQEPDIEVHADDPLRADPVMITLVEQHLRHALNNHKNTTMRLQVYKDVLSGGYSVLKVFPVYSNPKGFKMCINIDRVFDPTLCGFDQNTRLPHKGDGNYCFEIFPRVKEQFMDENPGIDLKGISFSKNFEGFNWSYINSKEQILLEVDYYEKVKKKTKIVMLTDNQIVTIDEYNKMLKEWGDFAPPPGIVGKPRDTVFEKIHRYRVIENKVLEHEVTDYNMLPLVFVDGNSRLIKTPKNGNIHQVTRPYVYNAKSAQRLKNYAGIAMANEIENIVQHKFIIKKEALPKEEELLEAIKDIQKPSNIIVNAFYEENPDQPIPEPIREISKVPAPPEVMQAFSASDSLIQNVLGSYDAALGINNNQLSGIAIVEAASQSNATAMPYIVGVLEGLQRAAEIYVDLMPKYYTLPGSIPVLDKDGKKGYVKINQDDGVKLFYDENDLNVSLKAGASFQVQKSRTIMMVKEMMGMSELFAQFIADKGLNFVLDNMEGKGIEQLKEMVDEWQKEMEQQKQQAMQMQQYQMMNNPAVLKNQIEIQKTQQEATKNQQQFVLGMEKLKLDERKTMAELMQSQNENKVEMTKARAEMFSKQAELKMHHDDMMHNHMKDAIELHHNISKPSQHVGA